MITLIALKFLLLTSPTNAKAHDEDLSSFFNFNAATEADIKDYVSIKENKYPKNLAPLNLTNPTLKRSIIHIHSNFSHDACDNAPFKNGVPDEACFSDFYKSFCDLNTDIVFTTEHADNMANFSFKDVFHIHEGEKIEPILENNQITGVIRTCSSGHKVHFYLGAENHLMPIGLTKHPELLENHDLNATYKERTFEAVENFKKAGALVGVAHSEDMEKDIDYLKSIDVDFMEIYNLHAEFLMMKTDKLYYRLINRLFHILRFSTNKKLEPDLMYLNFQTENERALLKWSQLALVQHITGTAGTDAHQNVTSKKMFDGERFDSYRRMQRWFSNYLEVDQASNRLDVLKAIKDGKNYVVFEVYGEPSDMHFYADTEEGQAHMGDTVTNSGKSKIVFQLPKLNFNNEVRDDVKLIGRILKASESGWVEVAKSSDKVVSFESFEPGVFRAEVRIVPTHLKSFIPGMKHLIKEKVWIYSNPIWLK